MSASHLCDACEAPAKLRCSGCSRKWYCSRDCQQEIWPIHIFECKVTKPIKTSYYLARAARRDEFPDDPQTLKDYGFKRCITNADQSMLLGLYKGLFYDLNIKPKDVHRWLVKGTLVKEIITAFESISKGSRGGYYPWFLEHQYILDPSLPLPVPAEKYVQETHVRVWRFTGGSHKDSLEDIEHKISRMSANTRICFRLYVILLHDLVIPSHPHPVQKEWVAFGFCTSRNKFHEARLGTLYRQLIHRCTFREFVEAYDSRQLIKLIDRKGLEDARKHYERILSEGILEEVLSGSQSMMKSVWYLKQFIEVEGNDFQPRPSIFVDYGFMNCKSQTEFQDLKALYKQVLDMPESSPLDLHQACIQGKLFEYIEKFVSLKKKTIRKQLRRLLKNPYPIPEY
ncbi:hypothetical protein J132_10410 [Termitomyces sp. J132]|nr:hypothetical protein C0989_007161 [Termitomyces sp. Mn162]KAH0588047.1 hypothetical protein H2248_006777 [Termitomyces sp. 'cryptogamus']KNZ76435.1 hypothetical protein J132_10410 [Termitomyces sp. J132]